VICATMERRVMSIRRAWESSALALDSDDDDIESPDVGARHAPPPYRALSHRLLQQRRMGVSLVEAERERAWITFARSLARPFAPWCPGETSAPSSFCVS
jgi:hypothetical protein